ncbi:MAG: putative molybdenum cofactor guanylyltransferase [Proteobacteria bacterium]|nr:putative molybdenum cofactor guanylyltransferase [Pseudomonadota bacterium]
MIDDCTAVVMAGGRSRRMGCDKATLLLGERTLLQRVVDSVQPLFAELRVSVRAPRADLPWPQICDRHQDAGPLAGLCAALEDASTPWIFALATDMPFVKPALIELLAQRRAGCAAVVPVVGGHPQPLAAFYSASCLATVRALLDETHGKRSLRAALDRLDVCYVDESQLLAADPELRSFFDLDTPQDLIEAIRSAGGK